MSYTALYREWRPTQWEHVVNQKPVIRILQNALIEGKVSHAYLFSGPRGTGKTTVARLLAKSVNCTQIQGSEPCNTCEACETITRGTSVDVMEIDAASNRGIDEIRSLRESVRYLPVMGKYKVYIIDEVHMLTQEAFNALLKTLEEPPEHVVFILATTAAHKIPVTIASRCQRLEFRRLSIQDIEGRLKNILESQAAQWETDALKVIARAASGSMRDALSVLDLCLTYGDGKILEEDVREVLGATSSEIMERLFTALGEKDFKTILDVTKENSHRGKNMGEFCLEIGSYARDLLFLVSGGDESDFGRTQQEVENMLILAKVLSKDLLIKVLKAVSDGVSAMRSSDNPRLVADMCLLSILLEDSMPKPPSNIQITAEQVKVPYTPKPVAEIQKPQQDPTVGKSLAQVTHDGTVESITYLWESLLDQLQEDRKIQARAYLLPAQPLKVIDDSILVINYPRGYATHMEQIVSNPHKQVVKEYLQRITGKTMDIRVEVTNDANQDSEDLHPLVQAAVDIVDGKVT